MKYNYFILLVKTITDNDGFIEYVPHYVFHEKYFKLKISNEIEFIDLNFY